MRRLLLLLALTITAHAQWTLQDSHTTADLRGIANAGNGIAWASGTNGTILRTEDAGAHWHVCTIPPGAEHLDFRGIQAFDSQTAIAMSSGKGDLSRLYKTIDACQTWKLVLTNPDKEGFFDAIQMSPPFQPNLYRKPFRTGRVIGDPVDGKFVEYDTRDDADHWTRFDGGQAGLPAARQGEALFAASNSCILMTSFNNGDIFVTGGNSGSRSLVLSEYVKHEPQVSWKYVGGDIPLASGESAGAFSIAAHFVDEESANTAPRDKWTLLYLTKGDLVAVGGDYTKPDKAKGTAAFSQDSGQHWLAATTPPHGYRSSVAYDPKSKTWITVGPNGTDISTDDGRNWRPLLPTPGEAPDADQHWNALSLPYVVGPHGRIATLRPSAQH